MRLIGLKPYRGKIVLKSGLHIGVNESSVSQGYADSVITKTPGSNLPYIPASSLKGKLRSLIELRSGLLSGNGRPLDTRILQKNTLGDHERDLAIAILKLFGTLHVQSKGIDEASLLGSARGLFNDCHLTPECLISWKESARPLTEIKSENSIDRITFTSVPRTIERALSGLEFNLTIILKIFDTDKKEDLETLLLQGIALLELDSLGGHGSRGYGKVIFEFEEPEHQDKLAIAREAAIYDSSAEA
jgi:CRISPR-associated protein Csm3